jgi:hypothetical protein
MQDKIFVRAAIAPRRLGSPSVSLLIEALNENDPKIRWVTLPGQIGLPAILSLTEALKGYGKHPDEMLPYLPQTLNQREFRAYYNF